MLTEQERKESLCMSLRAKKGILEKFKKLDEERARLEEYLVAVEIDIKTFSQNG